MRWAPIAAACLYVLLGACSSEHVSLGDSKPAVAEIPKITMSGRWVLSGANPPSCGMRFTAAADGRTGNIQPEGGCPGSFFTSRHWTLDNGGLAITNHKDEPLAQLKFSNGGFSGQSAGGMPVTLSR